MDTRKSPSFPDHYRVNYGKFQEGVYAEVRRDAFGEDIGQNSWHTADEQDRFVSWLGLSAGQQLLDVACGAGGPALRIAKRTGCSIAGIDLQEQAIEAARVFAVQQGLAGRARFEVGDATHLPFTDHTFDAVTCIDAINHFSDRPRLLAEWSRVLRPGGRLLFTDPIVVTGPLTNAEIGVRTSVGFYLVVPRGYDEAVLAQCGLRILVCEDRTANMARIANGRKVARAARANLLREIEGDRNFELEQEFLAVTAQLAREGRLSRLVYCAEKAGS
jgi:SAM-dependent methyltransferase